MGSKCPSTGSSASVAKTNGLRTRFLKATAYTRHKLVVEVRKLEASIRKDVYDRLAAELQDVLLQGWTKAQKSAIDTVIRAIKGRDSNARQMAFTDANLNEMIDSLRPILGDSFANDVAQPMKEIELTAYSAGLTGSVKVNPTFNMVDRKAIRFLKEHNVYWVKNFYDRQLREKITELGTKALEEGMSRAQAGAIFEEAFADQLETYSWRYWQGFANHVVTRSREFGAVEQYVRANREYLQVKAVLDHRTTEICRHMHDKVFKVSDAVDLRDQMMAAETPEQVIDIAPWMKPSELVAKPSQALPTHLSLPPYHFNCRSRTVTATEKDVEEQVAYEKRVNKLHKNKGYKKNYDQYRELGEDAPVFGRLRFDENVVKWMEEQGLAPDFDTRMTGYKKAFKAVLESVKQKVDS